MRRAQRKANRAHDRFERWIRRGALHGNCYMCALSDREVKATPGHGQLCERHFREVNFPKALNPDL